MTIQIPSLLRRALAAAVLVVALLPAAPAAALDRSSEWRDRAADALQRFEAASAPTSFGAMAYAYAASASARLRGWTDSQTVAHLNALFALRNPDGGWGIGVPLDKFGDGTVNPPDTTYTVTLAGHVGPVLLDAYGAGAIPKEPLQTAVNLLMGAPRIDRPEGRCLAFSRNTNDVGAAYCVHNVNAGAAAFLMRASVAVGATGLHTMVEEITRREVSRFASTSNWWTYKDTATAQDADHNSYSGESMYLLAYAIGRSVAYQHLTGVWADTPDAPLAGIRLVSLPGMPGSMSLADPSTTLWCELGDAWLSRFDAWLDAPGGDAVRFAVGAYYAARNAEAC